MIIRVLTVLCALIIGYMPSAIAQVDTDVSAGGGIRIGASASVCDSTIEGSLRWNTAGKTFEMCDGSAWQTLTVSGNAVTLVITPSTSTSMDVTVAGSPGVGSYETFTVQNVGNVTSNVLSYVLSNETNFDVGTDTCTGVTLAQNATCTIQVRPQAFGDGAYFGTLQITTNNSPSASLSGEATGACGTIGGNQAGGQLVACLSSYNLIVMEGGCDATVDEPNCSGGIDIFITSWGSANDTDLNADFFSDGRENVKIALTRETPLHRAMNYCNSLTHNGYSDWYLPSLNELAYQVYPVKDTLGEFISSNYWSSTEGSVSSGRFTRFNNGESGSTSKTQSLYIRCVRREETYAGANLVWSPGGSYDLNINSPGAPAYSSAETFTLENNGDVTSDSISLNVINTTNFELVSGQDNCSGTTLAPSADCTVQVRSKSDRDDTLWGAVQVLSHNRPILSFIATATNTCGVIGSDQGGGKLVTCEDGYSLITTPGNCTDSATPTCDNATDTLSKRWSTENVDINASDWNNGPSNTTIIMNRVAVSGVGTYPAAEYCANMTYGGYSDWYLPASNEVNDLRLNTAALGTLITSYSSYNASTERDNDEYESKRMSNGYSDTPPKSTNNRIRCVRRD